MGLQKELAEFLEKQKSHITNKLPSKQAKREKCICLKKTFKKQEMEMKNAHLSALARPKAIRLQPWPNPKMETSLPIKISNATLNAATPFRIFRLAEPKRKNKKKLRETDLVCQSLLLAPADETRPNVVSYSRIETLSKPKPKNKHIHEKCLNTEHFERSYFEPEKTVMNKNSDDWINHQIWLRKNSAPKRKFQKPYQVKTGSKISKDQVEQLVGRLYYVPEHKKYIKPQKNIKTEPRPYGLIRPLNVDWVNRLSEPTKLSSETRLNLKYDPTKIPRSVLRAKLTKRTKELAEPLIKSKALEDLLKEDPFGISPTALKYKASKRIKALAQPRKR